MTRIDEPPSARARPAGPLRILLSPIARASLESVVADLMQDMPYAWVEAGDDADVAFVSRDVTGLSTKNAVLPQTQRFHDALLAAPSLQWVHAHSAGADRPVYVRLRERGVVVTTSSGANAGVVVQTALAGLLALARRFPQLQRAQGEHRWAPLIGSGLPRDLAGQTAVIVGWGPIGRGLASLLHGFGTRIVAVRASRRDEAPAADSVTYEEIDRVLPRADWLVLACPLTIRTHRLIGAAAMARLPPAASIVNVARGELIDEADMIERLADGRLAGAYLDVFEQEPLPSESPLWSLPNVILTPHSAGHSDGNDARISAAFLENLGRWRRGEPLEHVS